MVIQGRGAAVAEMRAAGWTCGSKEGCDPDRLALELAPAEQPRFRPRQGILPRHDRRFIPLERNRIALGSV